ncbi:poly-beta-1,6-N-acetyl-D-glucosamine biosynthesis protein PgaD [Vreelandella alkaliphila]|uniref:Poly-beta-1,6-N-acetyl-D-glucosamine biosynthesis protein PgaD n=1 Tax=Vreelandella alkaliphila TaxID=272774 RepID=A0A7C9P7V0_9GAMM|nr:poly-beta-1,6-N-acetyl-D-glucosamine biosynthesis protein PgaD [Halomonas alkaliphila]NDL69395.1 poly-beta-1,6-N-acetyl-D-glucosamine biosynthesis protein PgaD [Halomonas alkaliphila]
MNTIITLPHRQSTAIMLGYSFFTLCAWLGYGYLLYPFAVLITKWLQLNSLNLALSLSALPTAKGVLMLLPLMSGSLLLTFICWAEYRRFAVRRLTSKTSMQRGSEPLSLESLAHAMQASPELATSMKQTKRGILEMSQLGKPMGLKDAVYQLDNTELDEPKVTLAS